MSTWNTTAPVGRCTSVRKTRVSSPEELTANVKEKDLEENRIVWLGHSPFNNTYGFATGPDVTEANGAPFTCSQ